MKNKIAVCFLICFAQVIAQNPIRFEKYGLKDSSGLIILEPKYDYMSYFSNGAAVVSVKENGEEKYGVINTIGKEIISLEYEGIARLDYGLISVSKKISDEKTLLGLFDSTGKRLLETNYKNISQFDHGVAIIEKGDNQKGLINRSGRIILPVKFASIYFGMISPVILVKESDDTEHEKAFYIDSTGKKLSALIFDQALPMENGTAKVRSNGKFGYVDEKIGIKIPIIYDEIGYFMHGIAPARWKGKWGIINSKGNTIVPLKYVKTEIFNEKLILFCDGNKKWGVTDYTGKILIPAKYQRYSSVQNIKNHHDALIVYLDNKCGIVNYKGEELIPLHYSYINSVEYDSRHKFGLIVSVDEKMGMLNRNGEAITEIKYEEIKNDFDGHGACQYALVKLKNKWGCLDTKTGKELVTPQYDRIKFIATDAPAKDSFVYYNVQYCMAVKGDRQDTIHQSEQDKLSEDGNWETIRYIHYGDSSNQIITNGGKWGLVGLNGKELSKFTYDQAGDYFNEGLLPVKQNNNWGFIDEQGTEVIPPIYESIDRYTIPNFYQGRAAVKKGDKTLYIDKAGKEINE